MMVAPLKRVVLASGNKGKLRELSALLSAHGVEVVPQSDVVATEAEETGLTFVENAILKARHVAAATDLPVIADDSGLAVDYLDGAPGIYSARYSGADATDEKNNDKLLQALARVTKDRRTAAFHCVLVFLRGPSDPCPLISHASWRGRIVESQQGVGGFGYDPLFFVPTHECTSAELDSRVKNQISHRGQALAQLVEELTRSGLIE